MKESLNKPKPDKKPTVKPSITASAGSAADLPRVEMEMNRLVTRSSSRSTKPNIKLQELRVTLTPMSKIEIAHLTTQANTDILTTKDDEISSETANKDQHSDEINEPEQACALDLSGYEAKDPGEPVTTRLLSGIRLI